MALTARFTADFSQFEAALREASASITTFERGIKTAAADINRMVSSLSGAEIQRQAATLVTSIERIGGAAKLTAQEQRRANETIDEAIAKYKALGQQAPAELEKLQRELVELRQEAQRADNEIDKLGGAGGKLSSGLGGAIKSIGPMIAGAFTVDAIIDFGKALVDTGGKITDLSNRLAISTDAVQEFEYIASSTGSTVESFAGAMSKLQDKLQEGSKGTTQALSDLNLAAEDLKNLAPDEAFTRIADAIKDIPDPMKQTQIAMELFGKAGVEMLPAIRDGMSNLRKEAHDLNQVIDKEGVKALDDFGEAWGRFYKKLQVDAAKAVIQTRDDFSSIPEAAKTAMVATASVFFKPFGDKMRQAQLETRELEKAIADLPDVKTPKLFETAGRGTAAAAKALEEDRKRLEDIADTSKKAAKAAEAYADEIKQLRAQLSGAALQADVKKLADAWKGLDSAQQTNRENIKRLMTQIEGLVQAGAKLPPTLQKIYDEHRKLLPVIPEVADRFRNSITVLGNYDKAAEQARNNIASLNKDGLIPTRNILTGLIPIIDASAIRTNNLAGQYANAAEQANELREQAESLAAADLGFDIGTALLRGFSDGGLTGAIQGVGNTLAGSLVSGMQSEIAAQVKAGKLGMAGAFAQSLGAAGVGFIASTWVNMLVDAINADENYRKTREAGEALGAQFVAGFGGPRAFRQFAQQAGASNEQIARAMDGTAESVQAGINAITPLIARYQQVIAGLGTAAGGVGDIAAGIQQQFANSASLTAENIDRINNLGAITGGIIANTVGRTGDLVAAIKAVGPAIQTLDELRDKFNLGDQLSPATQEVLRLYDAITANEDVFSVVSGIGQVMNGLGDALVRNTPLANAFGQELAAQFQILKDRGVDAGLALASMAPQLQELWELSKDGKIAVDETTQALLDQAEAQGIVGEQARDVNEQILDVLTELRDMFAIYIPGAIARTANAQQVAAEQGRQAMERQRAAARDLQREIGSNLQGVIAETGNRLDEFGRRKIRIPVDFDVSDLPSNIGGAPIASEAAGSTTVNVNLDGRTIAEVTAPHMGGVVEAYGVH